MHERRLGVRGGDGETLLLGGRVARKSFHVAGWQDNRFSFPGILAKWQASVV